MYRHIKCDIKDHLKVQKFIHENYKIELDPKPEYIVDIPTFENWINPKPKKEMTIRVLKAGLISNKIIKY